MPTTQQTRSTKVVAVVVVCLLVALVGATLAIPDDDSSDKADDPEASSSTTSTTLPFEPEPGTVYAFRTAFVPNLALEAGVGETVVFDNRDEVGHTFTSDEGLFDSGEVAAGGRYGYAYTAPGTYGFHCEIHPTMHGRVVVASAPSTTES